MSTEENKKEEPVEGVVDINAENAPQDPADIAAAYEQSEEVLENLPQDENDPKDERIKELEEENAKIKDQAMRALAEADNIRKRAERSQADASKFAVSGFAKDLLEVADNLRRAIEAVPEERAEDELVKNLVFGIEATQNVMLKTFEKHGIEKVAPEEGKFDPNFHEVMFEAEMPDKQPGEIIQLIEPGYTLNGRLLRAARVGVAKGGADTSKVDQEI